jgi:hypothetical protein
MERMMSLAAGFKDEDQQIKTPAGDSFKMTALLPVIKSASLKILVISLGYHTCYLILRLVTRRDRPLAINAYYGFDTSISPIYEMINLSQVPRSGISLSETKYSVYLKAKAVQPQATKSLGVPVT